MLLFGPPRRSHSTARESLDGNYHGRAPDIQANRCLVHAGEPPISARQTGNQDFAEEATGKHQNPRHDNERQRISLGSKD